MAAASATSDSWAPAPTAWAAATARLRRRAGRSFVFMVVLCVAIAALLTAFERRAIGPHLVYSFAIGFSCWLLIEGTRLAMAWSIDRLRRLRRLAPSASGFDSGWRGVIPAMVIAIPAGPVLGMALADLLTGNSSPSLLLLDASNTRITIVLTIIGSVASVFTLSTMERLSNARAQAEAAQRQAAENQLRLLQSQLEPHMLFNTLANLRVLIGLDPARAQQMLDRMIGFLRATLAASRTESHPLGAEFDRSADYLALMAVRMGDRLAVRLDLPADLRALPVPPLILQPLVENAIKHGLEPKVEGGRIDVGARRDGALLLLSVRDTGIGLGAAPQDDGSRFGLAQIRERLATLYGDRAALVLEPHPDGGTVVRLSLPIAPGTGAAA